MVISFYWAITTLSVVGYGDFYPVNYIEMFLGTLVLLGGVCFFSLVMGAIVEIIENNIEADGGGPTKDELNDWITSFDRFFGSHVPK